MAPDGAIGRSLASRYGGPEAAPLPERLADLLAALDLRAAGPRRP